MNLGYYHERPEERGLAHFLEHSIVRGGSEKFSAQETGYLVNTIGNFNPTTRLGNTKYPFANLTEDLDFTLDFISNMVFKPIFDESKVEYERKRILREMYDKRSNKNYTRNRKFLEKLYRRHPNSLEGDGKIEIVSSAALDSLRSLHQRAYSPTNSDLIIAGNLPSNIEAVIEKYFGSLSQGIDLRIRSYPRLEQLKKRLVGHWKEPQMLNPNNSEESSAEISLYFIVPPEDSPDFYALKMLSYSLGGMPISRLRKSLGNKGLSYRISSSYNGSANAGIFTINGFVPAREVGEAIKTIFDELKILKENPISQEEFNILNKNFRFNAAQFLESNHGHVTALENKLKDGLTPEDYLGAYSKLTTEEIKRVALAYLPDQDGIYALAISDPLKK
ncbi:insulinase family protein [Candidatus Pacearchaeota archaeon]|nr:insulinase family protein [Candidatus Pacearchaeota archaeon]